MKLMVIFVRRRNKLPVIVNMSDRSGTSAGSGHPESESKTKRMKVRDSNDVRKHLIQYRHHLDYGVKVLNEIGYGFCFVKFRKCNGDYPCNFSKAWCAVTRNCSNDDEVPPEAVLFGDLFDVDLLEGFLDCKREVYSEELVALDRLRAMISFLKDTEAILQKVMEEELTEESWASVLGTHVLFPLSVDQNIIVSDRGCMVNDTCKCGCNVSIPFGDTSIGHKDVWHGNVDIILGPVAIVTPTCDGDNADDSEDSDTEDNDQELKPKTFEYFQDQLLAKTIVFSFLQESYRVPIIAISLKHVKIYIYDKTYDLLYESSRLDLFHKASGSQKHLKMGTLLALWFSINYSQFSLSKTSHMYYGYTADFREAINDPSILNIYQNELKLGGCKEDNKSVKAFLASDYRWTLNKDSDEC